VVICGIFGGLVGPVILRRLNIQSKIAKGLAMGSSSHALGTARAMEMGALEGAISGLAIGIMGIMTALLIPFADRLF
jgi:putative effector of murein hydrolase